MRFLIVMAILAVSLDMGLAFDGMATHRHAAAHHKHRRSDSAAAASNGYQSLDGANHSPSHPGHETSASTSCSKPTTTVTIVATSAIVTTTTVTAVQTNEQLSSPSSHRNSTVSTVTAHNAATSNIVMPYNSQSSQSASSRLSSVLISGTTSHPLAVSTRSILSASSASPKSGCATGVASKANMPAYFGFNMVNQKPYPLGSSPAGYKTAEDWATAFRLLKGTFPKTNAVRMYSTMDPYKTDGWPHLENALQALNSSGVDLKILVGVWSDNYNAVGRFDKEFAALEKAITAHGCDKIFAVSVGNEDLERVKLLGESIQTQMVDKLVDEISKVREVLHSHGCCVPVTHTDTYNEIRITTNPWVAKLLSNVDQAIIANIFPYWEDVTIQDSWAHLKASAELIAVAADSFGKEVWLGETGWPVYDEGHHNIHGTSQKDASNYFQKFGCQVLFGNGTAFYYVDWDEDNTHSTTQPSWGAFDSFGKPRFPGLTCDRFVPEMYTSENTPKWLGGQM